MIQPLASRYYVRLLPPPAETASGIAIPETAQEPVFDAEVLGAGPGSVLPSGATYPMQARVGDRVVFERRDWMPYEDGAGFIADSRLVAVIPGPRHALMRPANDYAFVEPENTGWLVESEGGVLVAAYSLAGADARRLRQGDELYAELQTLEHTERYRNASTEYEQHRVVWDWLDGKTPGEQSAVYEAWERNGKPSRWRSRVLYVRPHQAKSGRVLDVGPGRVNRAGEWEYLFGDLGPGARVWFEDAYQAVSLTVDGRRCLAIRARFLVAVQDE